MATGANGATIPAGSDVFDPVSSIGALNNSLHGRLQILAANATARNALVASCGWTPSVADPLVVLQTDTGALLRYDGTRWHYAADTEIGSQVLISNPTLGTAMGTLCTVTATTLGGPLRVIGSVVLNNANSGADRTAGVQITLDGTPQTPVLSTIGVPLIGGVAATTPTAFTWEITATAGSHTILLQASASVNSAVTVPAASLVVIEKL